MRRKIFVFICFFMFLLNVFSQEQNPKITLTTKVEKEIEIEKEGKKVVERIPVEKAKKGDILVYTITYKNEGGQPANDINIVNPVPKGTTYISKSAKGKDSEILFSIDGGNIYQREPIKYKVKKEDGTIEEKIATPDMYTHIKWVIKRAIHPEGKGEVEYKVKVN